MSGLSTLMVALALVLWTKATITNSSTNITLQTSTVVTNRSSASVSVTTQASKNVATSSVASGSVTTQASKDVTSSSVHVNSASVSMQASKSVTSSPVASTSVPLHASKSVTTSPVASASVTTQASKDVTSSSVHVNSASVTMQASKSVTNSPVASASVSLQASKTVTSSPVASASGTIQASKSVTSSPVASAKSSPSAAVSATTFTLQLVSTFSAPGQTSKMNMLPTSVVPSPSVSKPTQVGTSALAKSKETVSVMTHLVGSLTVSTTNFNSTSSRTINTTPATSPATSTTAQPTAPTLPPGGTKFVSMEVSFDIEFKEEYSDTSSPEYRELKENLTTSLENVYKNVDGFVGVRILLLTKGSVVCSYVVILAKDSQVKPSELKEKLQQASDAGELFRVMSIKVEENDSEETEEKLPKWALVVMIVLGCLSAVFLVTVIYLCASDAGELFRVMSIKVEENDSEETEEKLPKWALVVMIVLGCLSAVFLVTVIYLCVKYRRSLYGGSEAYLVSSGEIGLAHTYDRVSIGDNKNGSNQGTAQKAAADRRVIGSHTNPTYGSNGALAD